MGWKDISFLLFRSVFLLADLVADGALGQVAHVAQAAGGVAVLGL